VIHLLRVFSFVLLLSRTPSHTNVLDFTRLITTYLDNVARPQRFQIHIAVHFGHPAPISTESLIAREKHPPFHPHRLTLLRVKTRRVLGEIHKAIDRVAYWLKGREVVGLKALLDTKNSQHKELN